MAKVGSLLSAFTSILISIPHCQYGYLLPGGPTGAVPAPAASAAPVPVPAASGKREDDGQSLLPAA